MRRVDRLGHRSYLEGWVKLENRKVKKKRIEKTNKFGFRTGDSQETSKVFEPKVIKASVSAFPRNNYLAFTAAG